MNTIDDLNSKTFFQNSKKVTYDNFVAYSSDEEDEEEQGAEVQAAVEKTLAFAFEMVSGQKINVDFSQKIKNRAQTPAAKKRQRYEDDESDCARWI